MTARTHGLSAPLTALALVAVFLPALAAAPAANSPLRTLRTLRAEEKGRGDLERQTSAGSYRPVLSLPLLSAPSASSAVNTPAPPAPAARARILDAYGRLPLSFEANQGQTDRRVRFLARGQGYTLFLTGTEAALRLSPAASPAPRPEGRGCPGGKARERACTIGGELRSAAGDRSAPGGNARERACTIEGKKSRLQAASPMGQTRPLGRGAAIRLRLLGANPRAAVTGEAPLPGKSNYFIGSDPKRWRTDVPHYAKVRAEQVYPGIDAVYYGNQEGRLEYDFEVAPGADPSRIRLAFSGAQCVELARNGDLLLRTASGTLRQHKPIAYQLLDGKRLPVQAGYALTPGHGHGGGKGARAQGRKGAGGPGRSGSSTRPFVHSSTQIRFRLGSYDRTQPLVIDPVLVYSTYLGGSGDERAEAIAVDGAGSVYVAGDTGSTDFPTTAGALDTTAAGSDAFVTKLDATGSALVYSTYLGGSSGEGAQAIAVDGAGSAYVIGFTDSTNFPTTAGAFDTSFNGGFFDAFVTKLDASGSALAYSTYLGGNIANGGDVAWEIVVDGAGSAYVAGHTPGAFPTTAGAFDTTHNGEYDDFVTKLNASGTALVYSTYVGGNFRDHAFGLAVDGAGSAYLAGFTGSADFPTTPGALDTTLGGMWDASVTKLNASGSALVYSTYLGGTGTDEAHGLAVDAFGSAYVTGVTDSTDFPTAGALQPAIAGGSDAFVTKLNTTGSALVYSTFLGGGGFDKGQGIVVNASDNVYVTGHTSSTNFPTADAPQPARGGGSDAFVTRLFADGSALVYSTYLGGANLEEGKGIAVDASGSAYVTGVTRSTNFPTVNPYQTAIAGGTDAFITRISGDPPPPPPAAPSNLTATAVSNQRIDLAWQDNADNESGFRVERWNGSVFAPIATVGANATSYSNTGLTGSTLYLYQVLAFNIGGNSSPSNQAGATTLPNPPAAPSNLVATPLSQTEIRLTWRDNASNEDAIEVWRSTGGPYQLHAGLGPNQTSYLDQNLTANTLYIYQVRAVNAGGDSAFSNPAGATTLPNPPSAPSSLTATAVSGSQINLAWADNSNNETEFVLEVSTDGGATFAFLATRGANSTSHSHTGLPPETTRHYRVKARNAGGESAYSNVASATTLQVPPAAPTNLTATALSSSEIRLNWNDVSGEQGYRIERRQGNDPFAFLANVGANATTYTDGGLQANKVYVYRVLAFNEAGDSGWSNEASARTLRTRPRPSHSLTATATGATLVGLAWVDDDEDEQGFILERSEDGGLHFSQVASLPANATRTTDAGVQGGRTYHYRLKAWNLVGESPYSNVASVTTSAGLSLASLTVTPTAVRGRRNATGKVTLTGAAPSGGVSVTLASSNVAASVPSSVTVPAGQTEATFQVTTVRVRRNTRVTLTGTLAAVQKTATLTVRK